MAVSKDDALLQVKALGVELQALHGERDYTKDREQLIDLLYRTTACIDAYGQAVREYAEWLARDQSDPSDAAQE